MGEAADPVTGGAPPALTTAPPGWPASGVGEPPAPGGFTVPVGCTAEPSPVAAGGAEFFASVVFTCAVCSPLARALRKRVPSTAATARTATTIKAPSVMYKPGMAFGFLRRRHSVRRNSGRQWRGSGLGLLRGEHSGSAGSVKKTSRCRGSRRGLRSHHAGGGALRRAPAIRGRDGTKNLSARGRNFLALAPRLARVWHCKRAANASQAAAKASAVWNRLAGSFSSEIMMMSFRRFGQVRHHLDGRLRHLLQLRHHDVEIALALEWPRYP